MTERAVGHLRSNPSEGELRTPIRPVGVEGQHGRGASAIEVEGVLGAESGHQVGQLDHRVATAERLPAVDDQHQHLAGVAVDADRGAGVHLEVVDHAAYAVEQQHLVARDRDLWVVAEAAR